MRQPWNYPSFLSLHWSEEIVSLKWRDCIAGVKRSCHWSEEVWLSGYFLQADGGSAACCLGRCPSGLPLFAPASDFVTQL